MYIDTHAHLYVKEFDTDQSHIIERALLHQVKKIVLPNIDLESQESVIRLADRYPSICFPTVGLHPCSVKEDFAEVLDKLYSYVEQSDIVAIGESGIDLYWDQTFEKEQEIAFRQQIDWAKQHDLPIIIHSRNSIDRTLAIIEEMQDGSLNGVFHCFSEGVGEVRRVKDVGFYMGVGGVTTFKKMQDFRDVLKSQGLEQMVLETDSPYLAPAPHRGKRNESSYIPLIAEVIADSLSISIAEVAAKTTKNALKLFPKLAV